MPCLMKLKILKRRKHTDAGELSWLFWWLWNSFLNKEVKI